MIDHLLLATDFSSRSTFALDRALVLANGRADHVDILHVIDRDVSTDLVRGDQGSMPPVLVQHLDTRLPKGAKRPTFSIRKGDPFEEILAAAASRNDSLIVMGTPRQRRFLENLRGTTLERVVRASTRPILTVRNQVTGPYRRILIATDLSDNSAHAIRTAQRLGLFNDAHITVVHALWPPAPRMMNRSAISVDNMKQQIAADLATTEKTLHAFLDSLQLGLTRPDTRVIEGTPQMAIRDCVAELAPDLVVLGTQGRSGPLRLVLGSVAEELLSWLPVDVLAVPPQDDS